MNGSRKQSIVYAVRDYPPLKESSVACSATTTDGARSLTMLWDNDALRPWTLLPRWIEPRSATAPTPALKPTGLPHPWFLVTS
ncbi:hypothetical protein IGI04_033839 [Brassica rapa subsp. trilocularis]|uniref:Uncharacterized protein n=1 Tax=Brassica rapa subsp. trilocularis TaxID=1813537 RepID=A0ABQ7L6Z8_BRACM|nr:hypothetical protein IGI04_033839 [Brassica rapa subsp. trilocularis]